MHRMQHSFYKECKRMRERYVLLKRTQKNARMLHSFEKNRCPTLAQWKLILLSPLNILLLINSLLLCQRPPLALAGPVSCFAKVNAKPVVPSFHVNPSRCITQVDLMVGTGLCTDKHSN